MFEKIWNLISAELSLNSLIFSTVSFNGDFRTFYNGAMLTRCDWSRATYTSLYGNSPPSSRPRDYVSDLCHAEMELKARLPQII